jgi:hypothetical protein
LTAGVLQIAASTARRCNVRSARSVELNSNAHPSAVTVAIVQSSKDFLRYVRSGARPIGFEISVDWDARRCITTALHLGPPPAAPASFASACVACSITESMLKLDGFCRGGNSLKLFKNSPTIAARARA